MDKYKFNYTVVRFVPEKTLGEFVNIGIILKCNETGFLGARVHQWSQRVSHFFKYVDRQHYIYAKNSLESEIERVRKSMDKDRNNLPLLREDVNNIFSSIVKPIDSAIQFSPVYGGITSDLDAELDYLFKKYVLAHIQGPDPRKKVTREQIEREIKTTLKNEKLASKFKPRELKCKVFSQKFPYVYKNGGAPEIIHPLSFDYEDEMTLNDTAYKWRGRLEDLRKDKEFRITMVVAPPSSRKFRNQYNHAMDLLKGYAEIVPHRELPEFGRRLKEKIKA